MRKRRTPIGSIAAPTLCEKSTLEPQSRRVMLELVGGELVGKAELSKLVLYAEE